MFDNSHSKRKGQLTKLEGSSFTEFTILNKTHQPILSIDAFNSKTMHSPDSVPSSMCSADEVIIHYRTSLTGVSLDRFGTDTSDSMFSTVKVSLSALHIGPVYVQLINQVIALADTPGNIIHPVSAEHCKRVGLIAKQSAYKTTLYSPMLIELRTTRTGHHHKRIYTVIHGKIVSVPIQQIAHPAKTMICSNDKIGPLAYYDQLEITYVQESGMLIHKVHDLRSLDNEHPDGVYFIDGGYFSFSRPALEAKLISGEAEFSELHSNMISRREHREIMDAQNEATESRVRELTLVVKTQAERISIMDASRKHIKDHKAYVRDTLDAETSIEVHENKLKRDKIKYDALKMKQDLEHREYDEWFKAVTITAKAVVIAAPIVLGVFKFISSRG